jgi:hypothetical protein
MRLFRSVAALAAVMLATATGVSAQTVVVLNAPAGSTIEGALNGDTVASATPDPMGVATLKLMPGVTAEMDARLYVESCGSVRRVRIASPGATLPALAGCTRQDVGSLFSVRPETSFVVDVASSPAIVRLRQGEVPASWLVQLPEGETLPERDWDLPARALVLSGGGGLINGQALSTPHCGDVSDCTHGTYRPAYVAAATIWLTRILGVQGSYARSSDVIAEGSGTGFRFDATTRIEEMNVAANVGVPAGIARVYAIAGGTFHRAKTILNETVDMSGTNPGGAQRFDRRSEGWGLLYGGGLEIWASQSVGFFAEVTRSKLKGEDLTSGDRTIDVGAPIGVVGIRINLLH